MLQLTLSPPAGEGERKEPAESEEEAPPAKTGGLKRLILARAGKKPTKGRKGKDTKGKGKKEKKVGKGKGKKGKGKKAGPKGKKVGGKGKGVKRKSPPPCRSPRRRPEDPSAKAHTPRARPSVHDPQPYLQKGLLAVR